MHACSAFILYMYLGCLDRQMFGKDVVQNKIVSGMRQGIISTPGTYTNTISIRCSEVSFRENVEGTYKTIYSKTCVKRPLSKRPKIGFHFRPIMA